MGDSGDIAAVLAENDGVITAQRAIACGLSRTQIRRRVRNGTWKQVGRGVFRSSAHDYTETALVRAAVAVHHGVADRTTAAWWHGLVDDLASPLTMAALTTAEPSGWTSCEVDQLRRKYHGTDVELVRGLPTTGLAMTVLTACVEVPDGARLIDRALQQHPVTVADLTAALGRNAGLRGLAEARRLIAIAGGDTESAAEREFVGLLHSEEITGWELQYRFGPWPIDVAWPVERIAVEIDGWAYHCGVKQFERDRRKRNALAGAHWIVLAFTWHQLVYEPEDCMRQLVEALAERRLELM